jgi:hypothetical protein
MVIPQGFAADLAEELGRRIHRAHASDIMAGLVTYDRPKTARRVIQDRMEAAREYAEYGSPEHWYLSERFGEPCPEDW